MLPTFPRASPAGCGHSVVAGQVLSRHRPGLLTLFCVPRQLGRGMQERTEEEGKGLVPGCLLSLCWPAAWPHELQRGTGQARELGSLCSCWPEHQR